MNKKTTHIRVLKEDLIKKNTLFPDYSPQVVFKIGLSHIKALNTMNEFVWGKKTVKKFRGLDEKK